MVAVAVAPAASVPLLPTPLKNATCTFAGWMAFEHKLIILTKKKDFEDVAGRRGVEPLC